MFSQVIVTWQFAFFYEDPDVLFYRIEVHYIVTGDDGYGAAFMACPSCTAYPVYIAVLVLRHVIIYHEGQLVDVDAPGCYVSCDQQAEFTLFELLYRLHSPGLRYIAVEYSAGIALFGEESADLIRGHAGVAKNHTAFRPFGQEHPVELLLLLFFADPVVKLAYGIHSFCLRLCFNCFGLLHVPSAYPFYLVGHRGGKKHRGPVFRHSPDYPFHLVYKAHVEHPVCLVEHQEANVPGIKGSLADMVVDSPRSPGDDRCALLQFFHFSADAVLAVHDRCPVSQEFRHLADITVHLYRKLAGRRQYESLGTLSFRIGQLQQ